MRRYALPAFLALVLVALAIFAQAPGAGVFSGGGGSGTGTGPAGATGATGSGPLAAATIMYVSATGNNLNAGTSWALAKATLAAAVSALPLTGGSPSVPYGTIYIGPGTFVETATPIAIAGYVHLECASAGDGAFAQGSVIQLGNGRNTSLISYTSALATANGYQHFFQVDNCTFDGNAANNPTISNPAGFPNTAGLNGTRNMIQIYNGGFSTTWHNVGFQNATNFALYIENQAVDFECYSCTWGGLTGNGGGLHLHDVVGANNVALYSPQMDNLGATGIYIDQEDTDTGGSNLFRITTGKVESNQGTGTVNVLKFRPRPSAGGNPFHIAINGLTGSNNLGTGVTAILEATGSGYPANWDISGVNIGGYATLFHSNNTSQTSAGAGIKHLISGKGSSGSAYTPDIELSGGPSISTGTGTPEAALTANVGAVFLRTDGGSGTSIYVKESGTGNLGWVAKGTTGTTTPWTTTYYLSNRTTCATFACGQTVAQFPASSYSHSIMFKSMPGTTTTARGASGGTGYISGDIGTVLTVVQGGCTGLQVEITTVSGGAVTGIRPYASGAGCSVANNLATTGGTGTGAQINITQFGAADGSLDFTDIYLPDNATFVAAVHGAGKLALLSIGDSDVVPYASAFTQATTGATLTTFISTIAARIAAENYDGVDIDWEVSIDTTKYKAFLIALRAALPAGKLITAAVGDWGSLPALFGDPTVYAVMDQINAMNYDMDDTAGKAATWHNAAWALGSVNDTYSGLNASQSRLAALTGAGVPPAKIGIGIPFYGRSWANNGAGYSAPLQATSGVTTIGIPTYRTLTITPATALWDARAGAEYMSAAGVFTSFTGCQSIQFLADKRRQYGFGGYMTFATNYEGAAVHPLSVCLNTYK